MSLIKGILKETSVVCQPVQCRSWTNAGLLGLLFGAVNFAKFGPYRFTRVFVYISCAMEITDKSMKNF